MSRFPTIYTNPPSVCDFCESPITETFYDAKTCLGPWANMCHNCWKTNRAFPTLGTGKGQKYVKNAQGQFEKVIG